MCRKEAAKRRARVKIKMGRESKEWVNKLKEKQQTAAMGHINGGWGRNVPWTLTGNIPDFEVQGMVVSRRTRSLPAAALYLFRQWDKGRCLKAMACTP